MTTKQTKPTSAWLRTQTVAQLRKHVSENAADSVLAFNEIARRYNAAAKRALFAEQQSQDANYNTLKTFVDTLCAIFEQSDDYMWPEDIVSVIREQSKIKPNEGAAS